MNILLTGGGTGGHVIPNIALIPYLRAGGANVLYMGSSDSIEERLMKSEGVPFFGVTTVKMRRDNILKNLAIPFRLIKGIREARRILREQHIDVVFAKGGYVSLPGAYAARLLGIPVICHESDTSLGMANKLISHFALHTVTSSSETHARHKIFIGSPIRDKIFEGNRMHAISNIQYDESLPTLLIMGGSSGAKHLNDFVHENIAMLTSLYNVVHITGKGNNHIKHPHYTGIEYTDHIEDYMALADLVITRSGANAVAELLAIKKRCILIPLETRASRGDQVENALRISHQGLAVTLRECDLTMDNLTTAIHDAEALDLSRYSYDRSTNQRIASLILDSAEAHANKTK